jgi:Protein of unknown function (DUF2958)
MEWTKLLRPETRVQLLLNHRKQLPLKGKKEIDFQPCARLHIEGTDIQWLLSEVDEEGYGFGLCQIHVAELGYCYLPEIAELDIPGATAVEDLSFQPTTTLSGYMKMARANGGFLIL